MSRVLLRMDGPRLIPLSPRYCVLELLYDAKKLYLIGSGTFTVAGKLSRKVDSDNVHNGITSIAVSRNQSKPNK
jgi:hypothetical protein